MEDAWTRLYNSARSTLAGGFNLNLGWFKVPLKWSVTIMGGDDEQRRKL